MKKILIIGFVAFLSLVLVYGFADAKVRGLCSQCHTMHGSQHPAPSIWTDQGWTQGAVADALLVGDCVGCHTGMNTGSNNIPYVLSATAIYDIAGYAGTTGDTLAGGNFRWVSTAGGENKAKGHNVPGISLADGDLATGPPGYDSGRADSQSNKPGGGTWVAQQVTCAGFRGCHGTHAVTDTTNAGAIRNAHHEEDSIINGSTVGKSYRFLIGILGKEDSDWEYQPTAAAHNQYQGKARADNADVSDTSTISYLCTECHGQFHQKWSDISANATGSPWIRHPTDLDMQNVDGEEYSAYNGGSGGTNPYSVAAPVASENVTAVKSTVDPRKTSSSKDAIVMCLSCHRAHGSPYDDLLRWDYSLMDANTSGTGKGKGCFICHTTKDAA